MLADLLILQDRVRSTGSTCEVLAALYVLLASLEASYITSEIYGVTGGFWKRIALVGEAALRE